MYLPNFQRLEHLVKQLKEENEQKNTEITVLQSLVGSLREEICFLKDQSTTQNESLNSEQAVQQVRNVNQVVDGIVRKQRAGTLKSNRSRTSELFQNLTRCFSEHSIAWNKCDEIVKTIINDIDI